LREHTIAAWCKISNWDDELQALQTRTTHNLRQFLHTELRTCVLSLEMARLHLDQNNLGAAQQEYSVTERGLSTIDHFLPRAPEVAEKMDSPLKELRKSLADLASELALVTQR